MKRDALVIKTEDNVATAIRDIAQSADAVVGAGETTFTLPVTQDINLGHKFALKKIVKGEDIIKYNCVIGRATQDIEPGEHAHIHNFESLRGRGDL